MSAAGECPFCGCVGTHEHLCLGAVELEPPVKPTSRVCYEQIVREGLLSALRLRVYETLLDAGPLTGRELDAILAAPGETRTSYHKRLSELHRIGLARVAGERRCRVTGRLAEEWIALDTLPARPPPKPPSRLERFASVLLASFAARPTWTRDEAVDVVRGALAGRTAADA